MMHQLIGKTWFISTLVIGIFLANCYSIILNLTFYLDKNFEVGEIDITKHVAN